MCFLFETSQRLKGTAGVAVTSCGRLPLDSDVRRSDRVSKPGLCGDRSVLVRRSGKESSGDPKRLGATKAVHHRR